MPNSRALTFISLTVLVSIALADTASAADEKILFLQHLPPASILRFKELSFGELYGWRTIAVLAICIAQAALIAILAFSSRRRRRAEEEKGKLAAIVESSDDAILSKTLDGMITSWNPGAEKIYGYSASEVVGRDISILLPDDRKEEEAGILDRIRSGQTVDHMETVRLTAKGRRVDVSLVISPVKNERGAVIGASSVARDITERKHADEERRESEQRFRMMADTAPVMIWVAGPDTLCTFFNQQWLEFTGRTMEQEVGNGWWEAVHPEDSPRCLDVYSSAFHDRRAFTMEYRLRRADGQYRWVLDTGVPRLLPHGELAGYIGSCVDISERKRNELALQQLAGRILMLQDEERRRVAAELHDGLGQSLAIIKNRALLALRADADQDRVMEQLQEISSTTTSAILEVHEIARNLRPYELDKLGLAAAIKSMIERISDTTPINFSLDLDSVGGLLSPEAETSVYRIVQESLNNIIKHSQATAARIGIKKSSGKLSISIQDNGNGIRSAADSGHNAGGFGLAGIAERVRGLGGSFVIDSQPGQGTTLTVTVLLEARLAAAAK